MDYISITVDNLHCLEEIKGIYFSSFPEEERRPWESIVTMIQNGFPYFRLYVIRDDEGKTIGLYTLWKLPVAYYVEHLAISSVIRNSGYGGKAIRHIVEEAGDMPVVLEVELPDKGEDAVRRICFYRRNGFTALEDVPYFQPPYRPDLDEVPLMLMVSGPLTDIPAFVIMLHTLVYNQ